MSWIAAAPDTTSRRGSVDVVLAAIVIALLGFGVVMVYSASVIEATVVFRDPQYFKSLRSERGFASSHLASPEARS